MINKTSSASLRDHPRMCGEHSHGGPGNGPNLGSSPHVRGALVFHVQRLIAFGIIPACAGSTYPSSCPWNPTGDHPRMCGEHCASRGVMRGSSGSSPHVRGARSHWHAGSDADGIIPACAGSTGNSRTNVFRLRDHPRMCGEHARVRGGHWHG